MVCMMSSEVSTRVPIAIQVYLYIYIDDHGLTFVDTENIWRRNIWCTSKGEETECKLSTAVS